MITRLMGLAPSSMPGLPKTNEFMWCIAQVSLDLAPRTLLVLSMRSHIMLSALLQWMPIFHTILDLFQECSRHPLRPMLSLEAAISLVVGLSIVAIAVDCLAVELICLRKRYLVFRQEIARQDFAVIEAMSCMQ